MSDPEVRRCSTGQDGVVSTVRLLMEAQAVAAGELDFELEHRSQDVILSLAHANTTLYVRVQQDGVASWVMTPLPRDRVERGISWTLCPRDRLITFIGEKIDALLRRAD
jgi:hypothetical protein